MNKYMIILISGILSTLIMVVGYLSLFSDKSDKYGEYIYKAFCTIATIGAVAILWGQITSIIYCFIAGAYK